MRKLASDKIPAAARSNPSLIFRAELYDVEMGYRCGRPLWRVCCAALYMFQRSLQYFPERRRTTPRAAGLSEAAEMILDTADGEQVIIWHVPPHEDHPVFLYFHGNGGALRWRDERFRAL